MLHGDRLTVGHNRSMPVVAAMAMTYSTCKQCSAGGFRVLFERALHWPICGLSVFFHGIICTQSLECGCMLVCTDVVSGQQ